MREHIEIKCHGLDGANPLHFLAAMGAFRLLCTHDADSKIRWYSAEYWFPAFLTVLEEDGVSDFLVRGFGWQPEEDQPGDELGGKGKGKKKASSNEKTQVRVSRLEQIFPSVFGADIIKRPASQFRELAMKSIDQAKEWPDALPIQDELVAAFASDGILENSSGSKKEGVAPSLFSFSNGGSGKCLLKDFRSCALTVNPESIKNTLLKTGVNNDSVTDLCWNPASQRSYAFQHGDPGNGKNSVPCDATANALAFIGLTLFPSMPGEKILTTVGINDDGGCFTWPLWQTFLPLPVVQSVLNMKRDGKGHHTYEESGLQWMRARRFSLNKRFFFSPSIPVGQRLT